MRTFALAWALLSLAACQSNGIVQQLNIPGTSEQVTVKSVAKRSTYLDAVLVGSGFSGRYFFPDNEQCSAILKSGAQISYRRSDAWGEVSDASGSGSCSAVGIGGLAYWRDQNPKQRLRGMQRSPARYRVIYSDDEYVLARGDFPLAAAIYWNVTQDTIAVIPRNDACQVPLERGQAQMEYHTNGPQALILISPDGVCEIEGFVTPIAGA